MKVRDAIPPLSGANILTKRSSPPSSLSALLPPWLLPKAPSWFVLLYLLLPLGFPEFSYIF